MWWRNSAIVAMLFFAFSSSAQNTEEIINERVEFLVENLQEEDLDIAVITDEYRDLIEHPINLNKASYEDLQRLYLLSDIEINHLLNHIADNGKLISIYELQAVPGFDLEVIRLILPFVKVTDRFDDPNVSFKEMLRNSDNEIFLRYQRVIEQKEGYAPIDDSTLNANPNKRYLGNPDKYYLRYRFKYRNNISLGLTAEKDPGEQFFKGEQKYGFDFYSAHLMVKGFGLLKGAVIGDYHMQLGQGLVFWSGLNFGKSALVMNAKRNRQGMRPYTSADENRFLRGAAVTIGDDHWQGTIFASYKKIDANVSSGDTLDEEQFVSVSSIQTSGYHRRPSEIEDRKVLPELITGGNIAYKSRRLSVGLTGVYNRLYGNVQRDLSLYNQFDFNSNSLFNLGLDYNAVLKNMNFFGEVAWSNNNAWATMHGLLMALDPRFSMSIIFRHYDKKYQSQYASGFGEGSNTANETGLYVGINSQLSQKWLLTGFVDFYKKPWLSYQVDAPSNGVDYLAQLQYKPSRALEIYVRYRHRIKEKNTKIPDGTIDDLVPVDQKNLRIHFGYKINETFSVRTRVEGVLFTQDEQQREGILLYQDLIVKPKNFPISGSIRYALFETENYDARIYAYENDLLYVYSIPAYFYKGSRFYVNLRITPFRKIKLDIWLRYSAWMYSNQDEVSSGLETINGGTKSEFKAQLRLRF